MPRPSHADRAGCAAPYLAPSIFNISGMSYGAISKPAVLALSTGPRRRDLDEHRGGRPVADYHLEGGCDIVFQIGTAKYGVRDADGQPDDDKLREVAAHDRCACSRSS
jgi:glutamate synthase domain-containing protein 2